MLFRKKIEPSCSYCKHGSSLDDTEVLCLKKGVVSSGSFCSKFRYDALKRKPSSPVFIKSDFSEEDFEI